MKELNLFKCRTLMRNLEKGARRTLKKTGADHVVYGVMRNNFGQLKTFIRPMSDAELEEHDRYSYENGINRYTFAVHAMR